MFNCSIVQFPTFSHHYLTFSPSFFSPFPPSSPSHRLALDQFEDAAVAAFEGCKLDDKNEELKALLKLAVKRGQQAHQKTLSGNEQK